MLHNEKITKEIIGDQLMIWGGWGMDLILLCLSDIHFWLKNIKHDVTNEW